MGTVDYSIFILLFFNFIYNNEKTMITFASLKGLSVSFIMFESKKYYLYAVKENIEI